MARQKEFDRQKALDSALHLFRVKGYGVTTTENLREAMGIGRQSFYDTFKGKDEIYIEALEAYGLERYSSYVEIAQNEKSPLKAIEEILLTIPSEDDKDRKLACLGVSSVCEFGESNKEIKILNDSAGIAIHGLLSKLIDEGQKSGEIDKSLKVSEAATFLLSMLSGLRVSARAGASVESLHSTVKLAVKSLKA